MGAGSDGLVNPENYKTTKKHHHRDTSPRESTQASVAQLAATVIHETPHKIQINIVATLIKWTSSMGKGTMVDELISDLSAETNFSEITAPLASFEEMTKSVPEEAPLWKLSCALELFSAEKVIERTRPNPDESRFIASSEIAHFASAKEKVMMVERMIRDHRLAFVPMLAKITGNETTAKKTVRVLGRQVVRLCLNKPPKATYFQYGCSSGKVDADKLATLQESWLKWA